MRLYAGLVASVAASAVDKPEQDNAIAATSGAVGRLVGLLSLLKKQLEGEFADGQKAYDTQACSYEDTIKEAQKNIGADTQRESDLTDAIEKNAADLASVTAKVENHKRIRANKQKERADAMTARAGQHDTYATTVDEYGAAIKSSDSAYRVLKSAKDGAKRPSAPKEKKSFLEAAVGVKRALERVPVVDAAKAQQVAEYLEAQSSGSAFLQAEFGPGADSIVGYLKDMRGDYIAKLQEAQEEEETSSLAHDRHVKQLDQQIRTLDLAVEEGEALQSEADADKAQNEEDRDNTQEALEDNRKLLSETDSAAKALAHNWAKTSDTHNDEMHGISKALDFLQQQGLVHQPQDTMFLQIAENKNRDFDNIFKKINWKIDDMVELHNKEKGDNQVEKERCETLVTNVESDLAKQKAQLAIVANRISETTAEKQAADKEKQAVKKERESNNNAKNKAQSAWQDADAGRAKEIGELKESVKLIGGAIQALKDAGSGKESLGNVIRILEMVQEECSISVKSVGEARGAEGTAWSKQKNEMRVLSETLQGQMDELTARMLAHDKKVGELEAKKSVFEHPISEEEKENCHTFIAAFQGEQVGLDANIRSLTNAKTQLESWQNQETHHADGADVHADQATVDAELAKADQEDDDDDN